MISLTFVCDNGHETQAFYTGNDKFQELLKAAMLECTACGQPGVRQGLSKPSVNAGISRQSATIPENKPRDVGHDFFNEVMDMMTGRKPDESVRGKATVEEALTLQAFGVLIEVVPSKSTKKPGGPPVSKHLN